MKKCPYCFEEIQDEAIKCKHCQSMLTEQPVAEAPPGEPPGAYPGGPPPPGYPQPPMPPKKKMSTGVIVAIVLACVLIPAGILVAVMVGFGWLLRRRRS